MTDSENSQPLDESEEDIYKDILEFNLEDELAKLEGNKETSKQEANDLQEKVKTLTEENKELKKSNEVLKKNLSTLLKTAQAEVQRKDSMIKDLRNEIDSFTLRTKKNLTKDKYTSTDDLELKSKERYESEKQKSIDHKKRSKSYENWNISDNERKPNQEQKKKEHLTGKEENLNCDSNNRKSDYYRENSKTNCRHSDGCHDTYNDRHRERKSTRHEYSLGYRKSYRENYRDHLKYDSFDKKRHSRSSDGRFVPRRKNSRERKEDCSRGDSSDRRSRGRRSSESLGRFRSSRQNRSPSREIFRKSKESSLEKLKTRSSLEKDSMVRIKEQISVKAEISNSVKNNTGTIEHMKRAESSEKRTKGEDETTNSVTSKQIKEKIRFDKKEKGSSLDVFNTKSPLDALYNDMITSRSSNRFSNSKSVTALPESDLEEGELSTTQTSNECQETSESPPEEEEDWTLSFKNERKNDTKSMTLYSRRMMRKFSSETKSSEMLESPAEKSLIESEISEKPMTQTTFREPVAAESVKTENPTTESVLKENEKERDKPTSGKEEPNACKEIESNKCDVIEFSPFKNNYKLIEISPVKPSDGKHILDFYNKRMPLTEFSEQTVLTSLEESTVSEKDQGKIRETSEEKDSWKNSSSEKDSERELKIIIPSVSESPIKEEKIPEQKEEKELKNKKGKAEVEKSKVSKKDNVGKKKRQPAPKKKLEKSADKNKSQKRKRKFNETRKESSDTKRRKIERNISSRKSTRSKRNSKSDNECKTQLEAETEIVQEEKLELENKIKEDISSFEFFKPVAKSEDPLTPVNLEKAVSKTTDYKMTAMMSVSGVVRLETPNKCLEKLNNLIINEQMIFNVLDSKNNSQLTPLIGSKCMEMTPRKILKNDLMLTDSEDDSVIKQNVEGCEDEEVEQKEVEEEKEEGEMSESENSECDSDSGASDFVDLL